MKSLKMISEDVAAHPMRARYAISLILAMLMLIVSVWLFRSPAYAATTYPQRGAKTAASIAITNLVVNDTANAAAWSVQTNAQITTTQYGDRGYLFATIPASLVGASWIRDANASKAYVNTPLVTFAIGQQAAVYVAIDTRLTPPAWIDVTWANSGMTLTNNEVAGANTFTLYSKTFPAGTVALGPNSTGNLGVNMYTIFVAAPSNGTPTPTPTTGPNTPTPTTIPNTPTPTTIPNTPTPTTGPNTPTPTPNGAPLQLSNLVVSDTAHAATWSLQTNLQIGAVQYGDRGYTIATVPAPLVGAQWIRAANASKAYTGLPTVSFAINQQANVYIALDTRLTPPSWLDATWTLTAMTLTNNEVAGANSFVLYKKVFAAGTVALGPDANPATAMNMYTPIVVGNQTGPTPTPTATLTPTPTPVPGSADWPQYLHDLAGSDYNSSETTLTTANIATVKKKWTAIGGGGMSAQAIVVGSMAYWGSWDGNFHATPITGATAGVDLWTKNLGVTSAANCLPSRAGVASTAAYGFVGTTPAVFVGGGGNDAVGGNNVYVYALNAATGQLLWKTSVGTAPQDFAWSSPLLFNGSVYYGMSSFGDCPLTRGRLVKLDQTVGSLQGTFYTAPTNCTGGGIWGTPTIDTATGMIFISTGTQSSCTSRPGDYGVSVLELNTATMSYVSSWQIPRAQWIQDADFGSAPTLFSGTINGVAKQLVGVANKNGIFYAFDRTNIAAGPVWTQAVAIAGIGPQSGGGSIAPAVWDGATLYVGGGNLVINGTTCKASINALNPSTGAFKWQKCFTTGHILTALTASPGMIVTTLGAWVYAISMTDGATLFSYNDTGSGSVYYSPATVANGYLFAPNLNGNFSAFSL